MCGLRSCCTERCRRRNTDAQTTSATREHERIEARCETGDRAVTPQVTAASNTRLVPLTADVRPDSRYCGCAAPWLLPPIGRWNQDPRQA